MDAKDKMETYDIESLQIGDYINLSITILFSAVSLYTGLFKSASTFLKAQIAINVYMGIMWLLAPKVILQSLAMSDKIDGVHMVVGYRSAAMMLNGVALMYVVIGTGDNTVTASLLWTKLIAATLFTANMKHSYLVRDKLTPALGVTYAGLFLMSFCWIVGNIAQLYRLKSHGGYTEHANRLNIHLRIDSVFNIGFAFAFIGYFDFILTTDTYLKSVDPLHLYIGRCMGITYLDFGLFSIAATKFLYDQTKVQILYCRFIGNIAIAVVTLGSGYFLRMWAFDSNGLYFIIGYSLYTLNALAGYLHSADGEHKGGSHKD